MEKLGKQSKASFVGWGGGREVAAPFSLHYPQLYFSQLILVDIQQRQHFIGLLGTPYRQFKLGQKLSAVKTVLRIRDILVRIWIRGSVPLTNGSGSDSSLRILVFPSVTLKMATEKNFSTFFIIF
jgi:hypothetical protein